MRPSNVRGDGVKMVNMGEIFAHDRIDDGVDMELVPPEHTDTSQWLLEAGDLLFARQSLVASGAGKCALFLGDTEPVTWESHIIRVRLSPEEANPGFYYYFFNSPSGRRLMWSIVEQVSAAGIRGSDLRTLSVPWCEVEQQDAIVEALAPFDERIAVARKLWSVYERAARALFQAWFVDYEPVCSPDGFGWSRAVRDLFPAELTDDGIPEGWETVAMGDIAERITDRVRNPEDWENEVLIDLARIPRQSIALSDWGRGEELGSSITRFSPNDTLFGAIRPYFHKVGIAPVPGVTNTSVFVLRARDEAHWPFLSLWASEHATVAYASRIAQGLKMPQVRWDDLAEFNIALPRDPAPLLRAFADATVPWLDALRTSVREVHLLRAAREGMSEKIFADLVSNAHGAQQDTGAVGAVAAVGEGQYAAPQ